MLLEILLTMLFVLLAARRRGGGRRRFNLRRVNTTAGITLGTLANVTVVSSNLIGASDAAYRMMSVKTVWSIKNNTAGEGPITFGYAHGDYSVTEIKEAIESGASISPGDKIAQEKNNRLVRVVGQFSGFAAEEIFNDGKPLHTRLNWFIPIGKTVLVFAYNDSGAALTTGGIIDVTGPLWVKDT